MDIQSFFWPKSIAIVGASHSPHKIGHLIVKNLVLSQYKGKIFPVNPKRGTILGLEVYPDLLSIQESVDLVLIAVPKEIVDSIVDQVVRIKAKGVVIISSGYAETGAEGLKAQNLIMRKLDKAGIPMLGPNCLGYINSYININATFALNQPLKGKIAFISQSGAIGTAFLDWAESRGVGIGYFISLGNKAGLSEEEILKYLVKDRKIELIALYLEEVDLSLEFVEKLRVYTKKKPILIIKSGQTEAGAKALGSHTGSIVASKEVVKAMLREAGLIQVETIKEMFGVVNLVNAFGKVRPSKSGSTVVTNAGGPGVVAVDNIVQNGLELSSISTSIQSQLKKALPPAASINNPIDILGDAKVKRYQDVIEILVRNKINRIIVILTPQANTDIMETARVLVDIYRQNKGKIVLLPIFIGGQEMESARKYMKKNGLPVSNFPSSAIKSLGIYETVVKTEEKSAQAKKISQPILNKHLKYWSTKSLKVDQEVIKSIKRKIGQSKSNQLPGVLVTEILQAFGIKTVPSFFSSDLDQLIKQADQWYPVALKINSPAVLHKTDIKGVYLDICTEKELRKNLNQIAAAAKRHKLKNWQYELQPMLKNGLELFIGLKAHKPQASYGETVQFNHVAVFGLGGIYTEMMKDFTFALLPLQRYDLEEFFSNTKIGQILQGYRGKKYDLAGIIRFLRGINSMVTYFPEIKELDINPLYVEAKNSLVVDAKMIIG